ncbi:hypothetical protein NK983_33395, partial [Salmonella enterica subsp. enterica serovar Typhimurium]|nr:hypothetical protein [Salmonella enterica subsp. enterica serovar Typhimurium]
MTVASASDGAATPAPAAPVPVAASAPAAAGTPARRLVQGQIYSYVKDGVRHYTSRPPKGVA